MAKRLVRLPLIKRQKAFLPRDSIAEYLIKVAKARKDDLFLVFMDVAKAFDLVSHTSLLQAAERIGVPASMWKYIALVYEEAEIQFKGSEKKIKQTMGIRQGCQNRGSIRKTVAQICETQIISFFAHQFCLKK